MRLLFSTRPAWGHVYPMMPLAEAARDAGHEVEFATTWVFLDKLREAGFRTHDVGVTMQDALLELIGSPDGAFPTGPDGRPDPAAQLRMFCLLARPTALDLMPLLGERRPDLVVYEQGDAGARLAAAVNGIPAAVHGLSPRYGGGVLARLGEASLGGLWHEIGGVGEVPNVTEADTYIDPIPASLTPEFARHPLRLGVRPVPWTEPGAPLPGWVGRGDRALVYLTLGTAVAKPERLRPAIDALGKLDADVLVALGRAAGADMGAVSENVHVHDFVDQARVLSHADLAIHHGGSGTTMAALANGVRQVALPKGADQYTNADLLSARGLAHVLEPEAATPGAIAAAAVESLVAPVPAATSDMQAEIAAMPSPAEVLPRLLAGTTELRERTAA